MFRLGDLPGVLDELKKVHPEAEVPCTKHGHASGGAAWAHIRSELRSGRVKSEDVPRLNAYKCRRCGKWHVGRLKEGQIQES